jgi:sortase A
MTTAGSNTRGRWLRRVEAVAFAAGVSLILWYAAARFAAEEARADGIAAFHEAKRAVLLAPPPDQSLWSPQRVEAFEESRATASAPDAVLSIPSLKLEVPVYPDTGEQSLDRGAGHIEGTAPLGGTGNTGIAAHRDGFFRKLERVDLGTDVVLDVGERTLRYRVSSIEIVMPTDVRVLAETASSAITLVTCYPFYFVGAAPQRYIVRADAVEQ